MLLIKVYERYIPSGMTKPRPDTGKEKKNEK